MFTNILTLSVSTSTCNHWWDYGQNVGVICASKEMTVTSARAKSNSKSTPQSHYHHHLLARGYEIARGKNCQPVMPVLAHDQVSVHRRSRCSPGTGCAPRSRCREVRHSSREFLKENPR